MEHGESALPVHVAQINCRDGFFLVARQPDPTFQWGKLAGQTVLADHGLQPLVMLKYAARQNGVDWASIDAVDAGSPAKMAEAFCEGTGAYIHLQSPDAHRVEVEGTGYVVASVGASMPPVAFSSLCCTREFAATESFRDFLEAFREARNWVRSAAPSEVAHAEASFFPAYPQAALTAAIAAYQDLGCWEGETAIPRDLYAQAVQVFQTEGAISRSYAYEEVCAE